ncbi:MAG: NAD(P)-dependent alcohol dehydrogenase [Phycisphaerales bacterium]|nr:NAD(P)-dependent alcohol dehydrogenase [Phycisphaerales bacterium]
MPTTHAAYAAPAATSPLGPLSVSRRDPGPTDVALEILFCGVCHSDLHFARNEWGFTAYPCVPGHEIVGRVKAVGARVTRFKVGQTVAIGCMVDSCRECAACRDGLENYCEKGSTFTYNSPDKFGAGPHTFGGYSTAMTVDQAFVLSVPETLDPAGAAPLLCAGITTYSPLRHWKVGRGTRVGVVGLGGLGHMALKLAHAMGAEVTLFTTSPGKAEDARRLGAHNIVISRDEAQMGKAANSLDFIVNTVSASHDLNPLVNCLRRDGAMCLVGAPEHPHPPINVMGLIFQRRSLAGSLIGGIRETQEMLDFCGTHKIVSDIERIPMQKINEAYERMLRSDVRYRFVIDLASLKT